MMFAFFAREPILDTRKVLFAYDLIFRDGEKGRFPEHSEEKQKTIESRFKTLSINEISGDKKSFVEFSDTSLIQRLPSLPLADGIIIQLTSSQSIQEPIIDACIELKTRGFGVTLKTTHLDLIDESLLNVVDIVTIDSDVLISCNYSEQELSGLISNIKNKKIALLLSKVETLADFEHYKSLGFDYFQGYFFTLLQGTKEQALPTSEQTVIELMVESNKKEFSIDAVVHIIERDASLAYAMMRFINNPMINKREKITSLHHALSYLGEVEVKKFIALLSITSLNREKPSELLQVSLVRAKFVELLLRSVYGESHKLSGFVVGLFSLLDVLLEQQMEKVLMKVPLADSITQTLLGKEGFYCNELQLIKSFESGLWIKVIAYSQQKEVSQSTLHRMFNDAVVWANEMNKVVSQYFPKTQP